MRACVRERERERVCVKVCVPLSCVGACKLAVWVGWVHCLRVCVCVCACGVIPKVC